MTGPALPVQAPGFGPGMRRELRTHAGFAWRLATLWVTLPVVVAVLSPASPGLARVVYGHGAVASPAALAPLYVSLGATMLAVWATSFVARSVLVPGAATGNFGADIGRRFTTRAGVAVAVANAVALTAMTSATVEAWVFPLLTFSACQVFGTLVARVFDPSVPA